MKPGEPIETRVYDIRDLLVQPDDTSHIGATTMPIAPSSKNPAPQLTSAANDYDAYRKQIVHELIDNIEQIVAPYSWKDQGGAVGTLRELQGNLIISQSHTNLEGVENVLNALHKAHDLMISIESRIVLVDEPTFQAFAAQYPLLGNAMSHPGVNISPVVLNNFELAVLIQKIQASSKSINLASPRVTVFNGQRVQIGLEYPQPYISDVHRQADDGSQKLDKSTTSQGIFMDLQSVASADRNSIAMNVGLELRTLLRLDEKPAKELPPEQHDMIQSPIYDIHKFNSLLSLQTKTTALLGGDIITTGLIDPPTPGVPSNETRRLLVLIRPVILQQENVEKNLNGVHASAPSPKSEQR